MSSLDEHFAIFYDELEIMEREAHLHPQFISLYEVRDKLKRLREDCEKHGFKPKDQT